MKIILVDKLYYPYSGIQDYFIDLGRLLRLHGHQVISFDGYKRIDIKKYKLTLSSVMTKRSIWRVINALYSFNANYTFGKLLDEERPDVVHINNIHHIISPSFLYEAKKRNIPIVYSLHDYKLVCPIYRLYRDGHICKDCAHGKYIHVLKNHCPLHEQYNGMESLFLFIEAFLSKYIVRVSKLVDVFLTSSEYVKSVYKEMGFDGNMEVIPHFVFSSGNFGTNNKRKRKVGIYFGRLVPEKGLLILIKAASFLDMDIHIIGMGLQQKYLETYCKSNNIKNIFFRGFLKKDMIKREIFQADVIILPSLWPEPFGKTIIEAFSMGKIVVASDVGGISEIISHGKNGFLVHPNNSQALKGILRKISLMPDDLIQKMNTQAYKTWKKKYNPDIYYKKLMHIYNSVKIT